MSVLTSPRRVWFYIPPTPHNKEKCLVCFGRKEERSRGFLSKMLLPRWLYAVGKPLKAFWAVSILEGLVV